MNNTKKISLALSGGGSRGAYHLGVLQYIDEIGLEIDAISGTSIGALVGVSYASGVKPKDQLEIFKSKEFKSVFSFKPLGASLFSINLKSEILDQLFLETKLENLKIPTTITAVNLHNGKNLYFDSGDVVKLCMASCALIPVFAPVQYENMLLADGGIINHMPLDPLENNNSKIVGINLHPIFEKNTKNTLWENFKRALYIMTFSQNRQSQDKCDILITTPMLSKYSILSFKHLDELFELGYSDAKSILSQYHQ